MDVIKVGPWMPCGKDEAEEIPQNTGIFGTAVFDMCKQCQSEVCGVLRGHTVRYFDHGKHCKTVSSSTYSNNNELQALRKDRFKLVFCMRRRRGCIVDFFLSLGF